LRRVLFLFLDGVGLGPADPAVNPLAAGRYPTLDYLLDGYPLLMATGRVSTERADLVPLDACLGVDGRPQSATGQASLLTGRNAPAALGEHYGPRPDARVRRLLDEGTVFSQLEESGAPAHFCNAYPAGFFSAVKRGKRLLSAIPYAAQAAGLRLRTYEDLAAGNALSADYTSRGWREQLGYADAPVYSAREAGAVLWRLARPYQFVLHEHWQTDLFGHGRKLNEAVADLTLFDEFLGGLIEAADMESTLIVVASDHGNVEDCSHGRHTTNPALGILAGARDGIDVSAISRLTDLTPVFLDFLGSREN